MPEFTINKKDIPLWNGADGGVIFKLDADPNAQVIPGADPIVDLRFDVDGGTDIALGAGNSVRIGVQTGSRARVVPIFQENFGGGKNLVEQYGLAASLNPNNLLMVLDLGGNAAVNADGAFHYSVLSANASVKAGADAAYLAARSFPRTTALLPMVKDLLQKLALPGSITKPPGQGDLISFEYGGYLQFGVGASAGYEIKGTKSFKISEIALSEHYALSVVGKLALTGQVAGRFSVEVSAGSEPGWAHVVVRRRRSKELQFAADVNVKADLKTEGLPASGKEFLGALLGVQGKSWLNMADSLVSEAGQVDSIEALKGKLDGLAQDFIREWSGKSIDKLLTPEVLALQTKVRKVVDSYRNLDQSAIALFDRYFDPVLNRVDELNAKLDELNSLTSWDNLRGEIDPMLWNVLRQLTGGDPLGWALGVIPDTQIPSLPELHKRVDDTSALIKDTAHEEIRGFIRVAKEQFPLDHFLNQLATVTTPAGLEALASQKLGHFVERLVGDALDTMNGNALKKAFDVVKQVVASRDKFFATFDKILKEAAAQSFALKLHAAYNSSDEHGALIDIEIRLQEADGSSNASGLRFMEAAGRGDFQEVLANFQPAVAKMREGLLTHRVAGGASLKFNVAGWHRSFSYEAMQRVIVNTEQQIRSSGNGLLTVFTTMDMTAESERRRNRGTKSEEAVLSNFILRFLAETKVSDSSFDRKTQLYALDVITGMSSSYSVAFTDHDTSPAELDDYLLFARQLGLDQVGATREGLAPVLELTNGSFGKIESDYEVRYTEEGIRKLMQMQLDPQQIRNILRRIVLANFFGHPSLGDVAWLYCSDDVRRLFDEDPNGFTNTESLLGNATVGLISPIPGIHPPGRFANNSVIRNVTATLFRIEDNLIKAFASLSDLLRSNEKIRAADLEKKLKKFGDSLHDFDDFDMGENSIFAVFDGLILLGGGARRARSSSLTFKSVKEGAERTKVFTLQAVTAASPGHESPDPLRMGAGVTATRHEHHP